MRWIADAMDRERARLHRLTGATAPHVCRLTIDQALALNAYWPMELEHYTPELHPFEIRIKVDRSQPIEGIELDPLDEPTPSLDPAALILRGARREERG